MNILDKFYKVTNYNLYQYFTDYRTFVDESVQSIISYYKGKTTLTKTAFQQLGNLLIESNKIESIIASLNTSLSSTTEFWDLIDNLSTIKTRLESTLNLAKWMRSSYVYGYENQAKKVYILKQNQTLENLAIELGSNNPNLDWVDIAVSNSLMELDYDRQGGNELIVKNADNNKLNTTSVVDIMVGDNILGKDLTEKIAITEDDIVSLGTVDTMEQSAGICLTVTKGSVPEFPNLGISKNLVGSAKNTLRASSLMRQVNNNFRTDDSFKSIEMINSRVDGDVAFYDFKIMSRLNNEVNKTL